MTSLFLRPTPRPDEPLDLFLIRVSAANCLSGPRHLMSALNLPTACRSKKSDLTPLAAALGTDPDTIQKLQDIARWPDPKSKLINLIGRHIPSVIMGRPLGRICPECWIEGTSFHWSWDIKTVVACEKHGCWLRDQCPSCESQLDWNRRWLDKCECGADLAKSTSDATPNAIMLTTLLVNAPLSTDTFLSLSEAARVLWFAAVRNGGTVKRGATIDRPSVHSTWELLEPVSDILENWPHNFGEWVLRDREASANSGSLYAHVPLMADIRHVFKRRSNKIIDAAADAISSEETLPALSKKSSFHRPHAASICPADMAKKLGVSVPRVSKMIEEGTIPVRLLGTAGSRRVIVIHRDAQLTAASVRPPMIREVATEIGISDTQVVLLKKAGLLPNDRNDLRTGAERLIRDLSDRAFSSPFPLDNISLSEVPSLRRPPLATAIELILKRDLPVWIASNRNLPFNRLLVSRIQLLQVANAGMTVREVAERLSIRTSLVPRLLRAGCLSATAFKRRSIDVGSVFRFEAEFATSKQLARLAGTNTRTIIARLVSAGFSPLVESEVSKGISSVWRRSDFESL